MFTIISCTAAVVRAGAVPVVVDYDPLTWNMDVEMTIDAIHNMSKYDIAVLFSGDADFLALVSYIRNGGKRVYIYSSKDNISRELKTGGNGYCDLRDIDEFWGKALKHRTKH